jgi:hypothetical protein
VSQHLTILSFFELEFMSKDRSEFETPELDFIENIDSFHSSKHSYEIEDESTTPFVFTLNHAFSFSVRSKKCFLASLN